jgi:hypothetical protein
MNGTTRRQLLTAQARQCVLCHQPVVSARGKYCAEHASGAARTERWRHRQRIPRVGAQYICCAHLGCDREIIGAGATVSAQRDRWHHDDTGWLCPHHAPATTPTPCADCGSPAPAGYGRCLACTRAATTGGRGR